MLNKMTDKVANNPVCWGFDFLSGFMDMEADKFYRIKVEETESTCKKCKEMKDRIFLKTGAVEGENFPPFHPNCRCVAVDKDGNKVELWSEKIINSLVKTYGFTEKESELILKAYRLLLKEANDGNLSRREKIHHIFRYLAALNDAYSGEAFRWVVVSGHPSTEKAQNHLLELGMGKYEVFLLHEAINKQYLTTSQMVGKDFAHELVQFSTFSNDSFLHKYLEKIIGNLDALGSYKGDVFSARMELDDMNSDVDANNIYHLFLSKNKDFLEIITEYNDSVNDKEINRVDEFLKLFGNGDIERGLEYIKNDLYNIDGGSHYLSGTYDYGKWGFVKEFLQDILSSENPNAASVFEEDRKKKKGETEESIEAVLDKFIDYLRKGMSK